MSSPDISSLVTDTGPLISLERLDGGYAMMRRMYRRIVAPPAVLKEIVFGQSITSQLYLERYQIADFVYEQAPNSLQQGIPWQNDLHIGELEAISLAQQLQLPLLIEEAVGRRVAQELHIPFSGIAGQVLKAKRLSILTRQESYSMLEQLLHNGRIGQTLFGMLTESLTQ